MSHPSFSKTRHLGLELLELYVAAVGELELPRQQPVAFFAGLVTLGPTPLYHPVIDLWMHENVGLHFPQAG